MKSWPLVIFALLLSIVGYAVTAQGLTFTNVTRQANLAGFNSARGVAWVDYNRDGYLDLLVGSEQGANRLHKNLGDGTFENATQFAGIPQRGGIWGVNFADIDNDGYQDFYLSARAPDTISAGRNILLANTGLGTFDDISDSSQANVPGGGIAACFAPFDKGPYVDLFVPNQYYPDREYPYLLMNVGGRFFADRTEAAGLHILDWWDVPVAFDFDNDRQLELLCTKDYNGNSMYDMISGRFTDITDSLHIQTPCGYGATVGDVNNDGWFDMYITNWHSLTDNLFLYDTLNFRYRDATSSWHVPGNTWTSAAHLEDFDNDGWLDLFITAAGTGNRYYHNLEGGGFEDLTGQVGLTNNRYNWGAGVGDYNNDGFLDIYMPEYAHTTDGGRLYKNNGNENNWFAVELQGVRSNRDAIGARLQVDTDNLHQLRQVIAGSGFGSQNTLIQHFGLGQDEIVRQLTITWPSGRIEVYEDLPANQQMHFVEGDIVGIDEERDLTPRVFGFKNAYPNPFNASTRIELEIYESNDYKVEIVDLLGREIRVLFDGWLSPQSLSLSWNGTDDDQAALSSGIYFCRAKGGQDVDSIKLLLVK